MNSIKAKISLICLFLFSAVYYAFSQVELEPWGNLSGIRIDGQLMEVESNLSVVKKGGQVVATGKEKQRPRYVRKGTQQTVTTTIDSLDFTEMVEEADKGSATINVQVQSRGNDSLTGIYFRVMIPHKYYAAGTFQTKSQKAAAITTISTKTLQLTDTVIRFTSPQRQLAIHFPEPTTLMINKTGSSDIELSIPIHSGSLEKGQTTTKTFSIQTSGTVDKKPVTLTLNTATTGRTFDGLGGNFRLQNARTDPQVIDYSLANLRVAWSRVEMPWRFWQPLKNSNPMDTARAGRLHPQVKAAMEMAQRLSKMGIPVILSAWSAPAWAIVGPPRFRPSPEGIWGNPLNVDSTQEIYKSIGDYIAYLKEVYGVEVAMFSFNESDLGINIRQTGEEHATLIKGLGAHLQQRGLQTKMLLGDNSDATTYTFVDAALNDPATHPYIGAVSFHSWRGWEKETLQKWADAATKINKPLLVGEGSIDAQAWGYPMIFEEPTYALQEINLYTRLLSICQPASILQWQLTADYSPLAGGGIFGDNSPLHPTQRFWNLKQLASTPKGLKAMPLSTSTTSISCAALGDDGQGMYALHLVNNGATRPVTLSGLPKRIKNLQVFVTDVKRAMQEEKKVPVVNGVAKFTLDETSYMTLIGK